MAASFLRKLLGRPPTPPVDGPPKRDAQLNIYNAERMTGEGPQHFEFLRFDSNNDCNVQCVYCHNPRSKDLFDPDAFASYLRDHVVSLDNFQLGCIMEPTLDARMCDFLLRVREAPVPPTDQFILQTNGILLHRHDFARMRDAGLTCLSVSLDSPDPATLKQLRGGTSLRKVTNNILSFREALPDARVVFLTTVTRANLAEIDALVAFGLDLGVERFVLREIFYFSQEYFEDSKGPEKNRVDHARMPDLLLQDGEFARMRKSLLAKYGKRTTFEFADNTTLNANADRMKKDSLRP
jgi:MoaA/NifB/PqqE/SkfB family radical SAM enzyme